MYFALIDEQKESKVGFKTFESLLLTFEKVL